jgi:hypothetical protein
VFLFFANRLLSKKRTRRLQFKRAQYVYNVRHPEQSPTAINPQPPVRRDFSRHPSLALHQLERRFLSHQEPTTKYSEVCQILILILKK